jgi:glucoamylase
MPRDVPVSNGNLLVNFDLEYRVRDIYFPWIGQENHRGEGGCRLGVWVDGSFSWVGPEWDKDIRYGDDSLVTEVSLTQPIQEDSTALLLWALWVYYECSRDIEVVRALYESVIVKCSDFLVAYRDPETLLPTPSYDLWEERYGVHAYTVATVIAGLRGAAQFARVLQDSSRAEAYDLAADQMVAGIAKHLYHGEERRYARSGPRKAARYELDGVVDVSLLGLVTFGGFSPRDPRVLETVEAIRRQLVNSTSIGGVARYRKDQYQRDDDVPEDVAGNPWFIATLWLAEYEIARAETLEQLREAVPYLEWCANNALPSGVLAEQVHPVSGRPLSVSPLTWSHSAFVWAVLLYVGRFRELERVGRDSARPEPT